MRDADRPLSTPVGRLLREVCWAWRCLRPGGYGLTTRKVVSPHPAPPSAVERLKRRVLSGDWSSPDA